MARGHFLKIMAVLLPACWGLCLAHVCVAEEPLKLKIVMNYMGHYTEPLDRTFTVRGKYPGSFQVIVTNTSSSSQSFYESAASGGYSSISFEITDEEGNSNVVRKKRDPNASSAVVSTHMKPGESRAFDIFIEEDTWEGAYKLQEQGARKFRVRAAYDNNGSTIYSDYYNLEVVELSDATGRRESGQDNSSDRSSVLVSE
jgi:hypothetical protein